MDLKRQEGGTFAAYAWPGAYPLVYYTGDGGALCPGCANRENGSLAGTDDRNDPNYTDDPQWQLEAVDAHWEGPPIRCEHCNTLIESAYGDRETAQEG